MDWDYLKHADSIDSTALRELMDEYGNDICHYAYMITKNREQAKDIAQETFIKAYRKIHTYRGQSSVKAWLFAIARNTALGYRSSSYFRKMILYGDLLTRQTAVSAETAYFERQKVRDIWDISLGDFPESARCSCAAKADTRRSNTAASL